MILGIEATHANKKQRTGVEEYCWHVIQELKKQIPSSVRVILYTNRPLISEFGVLPINWEVKVLRWPFGKGWSQVRLSLEFLFNPPDIFFAPGQLIPLICPENAAVTIHDSAFMAFPETYRFWSRQYLKLMNRLIIKKAKIIFTPSEFSRRELTKYYSINENKIIAAPLGYNRNLYYFNKDEDRAMAVKARYNIDKPFILTVGRLERKKNTANIIRAFNLIRNNIGCQIVLAGQPGCGYSDIKKCIDDSPCRKDIIQAGWVESKNISVLMNMAKVFVFPSLYEGFGIPVLEAMACGCPVVASQGNSLKEVGGEAAIYVDSNNVEEIAAAILKLFNDSEFRRQRVDAGLKQAEKFNWTDTARAIWYGLSRLSK